MTPFNSTVPNTFAGGLLDRAGELRRNPAVLAEKLAHPDSQLLVFQNAQPVLVADGSEPLWLTGAARDGLFGPAALTVFLGLDQSGVGHFAVAAPRTFSVEEGPLQGLASLGDLRLAAAVLGAGVLAQLGRAMALFEWHARTGFCAACGTGTTVAEGGWKRVCPACTAEHFPRIEPVAIMLPVYGDKCFLGRQSRFPPGMFSALAGFIEPGESLEEGCARETLEEAGLPVVAVRYHSSQPWPFPASLMIGLIAEVAHDRDQIDPTEIEAGRWFTREEARQLITGTHPECFCPPPLAIAHHLLKAWALVG